MKSDRQLREEAPQVRYAFKVFGDNFLQQLGSTMIHADIRDLRRIHDTWPKEWKLFLKIYIAYHEQLDKEADDEA